uniref:Uncharacterized protein n=1 Tax=Schistocephalus solidus TaxID=70667 RepID=A0A183TDY0_SCHSO
MLSYWTAFHDSNGFYPALIQLGRELRLPADIHLPLIPAEVINLGEYARALKERLVVAYRPTADNIQTAQQHQKRCYDRHAAGPEYRAGNSVLLFRPRLPNVMATKFHPRPVHHRLLALYQHLRPLRSPEAHHRCQIKLAPCCARTPGKPSINTLADPTETEPDEPGVLNRSGTCDAELAEGSIVAGSGSSHPNRQLEGSSTDPFMAASPKAIRLSATCGRAGWPAIRQMASELPSTQHSITAGGGSIENNHCLALTFSSLHACRNRAYADHLQPAVHCWLIGHWAHRTGRSSQIEESNPTALHSILTGMGIWQMASTQSLNHTSMCNSLSFEGSLLADLSFVSAMMGSLQLDLASEVSTLDEDKFVGHDVYGLIKLIARGFIKYFVAAAAVKDANSEARAYIFHGFSGSDGTRTATMEIYGSVLTKCTLQFCSLANLLSTRPRALVSYCGLVFNEGCLRNMSNYTCGE